MRNFDLWLWFVASNLCPMIDVLSVISFGGLSNIDE